MRGRHACSLALKCLLRAAGTSARSFATLQAASSTCRAGSVTLLDGLCQPAAFCNTYMVQHTPQTQAVVNEMSTLICKCSQ